MSGYHALHDSHATRLRDAALLTTECKCTVCYYCSASPGATRLAMKETSEEEAPPKQGVWGSAPRTLDVDDLGEARGLAPQAVAPLGAAPQPGESREERTDSRLAAGQG